MTNKIDILHTIDTVLSTLGSIPGARAERKHASYRELRVAVELAQDGDPVLEAARTKLAQSRDITPDVDRLTRLAHRGR